MKYCISEALTVPLTAGEKARRDCEKILNANGYKSLTVPYPFANGAGFLVRAVRQLSYTAAYIRIVFTLKRGDTLAVQHPFMQNAYLRNFTVSHLKKRGVKILRIIHDINTLRGEYTGKHLRDDDKFIVKDSDYIICHNDCMKDYLMSLGAAADSIETLGVFDYLTDCKASLPRNKNEIVIAGNLDKRKSGYIYKLSSTAVTYNLYGVNFSGKNSDCVKFKGIYTPESLAENIEGGFGLVWDGDSTDTCSGDTGNYLKYNSPHKLSLYIASSIPVIVWSQSAAARYVCDNKIGFSADSISDAKKQINKLSATDYDEMLNNVKKLSNDLRQGKNLSAALKMLSL